MIKEWLNEYDPANREEATQALREMMQEIALAGLYRAGFFEKAAFYGRYAPELCYRLISQSFANGHELLLTTTVRRPVANLAAIPFIQAVGGKQIGQIKEEYPAVGRIDSAIWAIEAAEFFEKVGELSFYRRMRELRET